MVTTAKTAHEERCSKSREEHGSNPAEIKRNVRTKEKAVKKLEEFLHGPYRF
jgi:hypothetical protein